MCFLNLMTASHSHLSSHNSEVAKLATSMFWKIDPCWDLSIVFQGFAIYCICQVDWGTVMLWVVLSVAQYPSIFCNRGSRLMQLSRALLSLPVLGIHVAANKWNGPKLWGGLLQTLDLAPWARKALSYMVSKINYLSLYPVLPPTISRWYK